MNHLSRQRGGWRQARWGDLLPGRQAEPKRGRGRLPPEVARERIDGAKAAARLLLTGHGKTFRQLMVALDYYESEIRTALRELGATHARVDGVRCPVYTLPASSPSLN